MPPSARARGVAPCVGSPARSSLLIRVL